MDVHGGQILLEHTARGASFKVELPLNGAAA
jgi:hypothetical protein